MHFALAGSNLAQADAARSTERQTGTSQSSSAPLFPRQGKLTFSLVTGLFFLWAIPNNLNEELIRQFMKFFESMAVPLSCYAVVAAIALRRPSIAPHLNHSKGGVA